jgi:hypothetical protein
MPYPRFPVRPVRLTIGTISKTLSTIAAVSALAAVLSTAAYAKGPPDNGPGVPHASEQGNSHASQTGHENSNVNGLGSLTIPPPPPPPPSCTTCGVSERSVPSFVVLQPSLNSLLPIAPTNGADQRLGLDLNRPNGVIVVSGEGVLGLLPGGGAPSCNIGQEGLAASLATCASVVNFAKGNDLLD